MISTYRCVTHPASIERLIARPESKVEKHDPYAAHDALLDQYTDKNIHDVVAYLETLK